MTSDEIKAMFRLESGTCHEIWRCSDGRFIFIHYVDNRQEIHLCVYESPRLNCYNLDKKQLEEAFWAWPVTDAWLDPQVRVTNVPNTREVSVSVPRKDGE